MFRRSGFVPYNKRCTYCCSSSNLFRPPLFVRSDWDIFSRIPTFRWNGKKRILQHRCLKERERMLVNDKSASARLIIFVPFSCLCSSTWFASRNTISFRFLSIRHRFHRNHTTGLETGHFRRLILVFGWVTYVVLGQRVGDLGGRRRRGDRHWGKDARRGRGGRRCRGHSHGNRRRRSHGRIHWLPIGITFADVLKGHFWCVLF